MQRTAAIPPSIAPWQAPAQPLVLRLSATHPPHLIPKKQFSVVSEQ